MATKKTVGKTTEARSSLVRTKLVEAGVKNLREFGYLGVNTSNILTDQVYKAFFVSMLKDNKGLGFDKEIDALLSELQ